MRTRRRIRENRRKSRVLKKLPEPVSTTPRDSRVRNMDSITNRERGKDIFVLGTSGSLNELDLSILDDKVTIGTNHILWKYITKYVLMVDAAPLNITMPLILDADPVLLLRRRLAHVACDRGFEGEVYAFDVMSRPDYFMKGALRQVNNSGLYAIEAAWRMRGQDTPGDIVLVGIDMYYPKDKTKAHFFGSGSKLGCRPGFSKTAAYLQELSCLFAMRNINLVTCSPWDGPVTEVLPRKDLREYASTGDK